MKRRLNILAYLCILLTVLTVLTLKSGFVKTTAAKAATPAAPTACGAWSIIPSANVPNLNDSLDAIATVSLKDVWSVGFYLSSFGYFQTLTEHWNGIQWSLVPSPNVGTGFNVLNSVVALSSHNVWAVGYYSDHKGNYFTLAEHWNGTQWSVVATPNVNSSFNVLQGVTAIAANDIWAVGTTTGGTLIEHWNGTQWSVVPSGGQNGGGLKAVSASATNDVWAVGNAFNSNGKRITLTEHWDGTRWSEIVSPNNGQKDNYLNGVTVRAANDVWAVGAYVNKNIDQTLTEHWNGTTWSVVPSPNVGPYDNGLTSVAASSSNVWAVGNYVTNKTNVAQALVEQWNGTNWSVVATPKPHAGGTNAIGSVSVIPGTNMVWAAGFQELPAKDNLSQTLTEFYC